MIAEIWPFQQARRQPEQPDSFLLIPPADCEKGIQWGPQGCITRLHVVRPMPATRSHRPLLPQRRLCFRFTYNILENQVQIRITPVKTIYCSLHLLAQLSKLIDKSYSGANQMGLGERFRLTFTEYQINRGIVGFSIF